MFSWPKSWRQGGSWSTAQLTLNLDAMWRQMFIFMPRTLYSLEIRLMSFSSVSCGPQRPRWRFGEKTNLLSPLGFEIWIIQPLAWSLHLLSYPSSAYFRKGRKTVRIMRVFEAQITSKTYLKFLSYHTWNTPHPIIKTNCSTGTKDIICNYFMSKERHLKERQI
jgi:hypothetical protein